MKEQKSRRKAAESAKKPSPPVLAKVEDRPAPAGKRTFGRPFQPGDDPRRHMSGRKCADAIAFAQEFNRALAEGGDPRALASLIWKRAMKGQPYAIDVILDRLLGPVTKMAVISNQPILFSVRYEPDKDPNSGKPNPEMILNVPPSNVPGHKPAEG